MSQENKQERKEKTVYFIEQEKFETDQEQLSVQHLLVEDAKEDPATTTLGTRHGNDIIKYTNLDQLITIKNGMKFIIFHNEPTPVSQSE